MNNNTNDVGPMSPGFQQQPAPQQQPVFQQPIQQQPLPINPPLPKKIFSRFEAWMSLICLVLGFVFVKLAIVGGLGLGASIFFLAFGLTAIFFLKNSHVKLVFSDYLQLFIILGFSLNLSLTSNVFIKVLTLLFLFLACAYFCFASNREQKSPVIQKHFLRDSIQALFVAPFCRYGDCGSAFGQLMSRKKQGRNPKFILLGLVIAVPITITVAYLLLHADPVFEKLFSDILDNLLGDILICVLQIGLGVPAAFYFFSMLSSGKHKDKPYMSDEACVKASDNLKIAPASLLCTAIIPACILYILFFISQSAYFLSAFQSYLPADFSYAEFARRGFFELCVIAVINLVLILALQLFCKKKGEKPSLTGRIFTIVLSVFTILLIVTALSKMVLYIDAYGFTSMRIYPSWFMLLLAVLFIFIIIKAIIPKINFFRLGTIAFVVLFAALSFSNIDGIIAKYNVKWYQEGKLEEVDTHYLSSLSHEAIPHIIPLCNDKDPYVAYQATNQLNRFVKSYESRDFRAWNLQSYRAYQAVKNAYPNTYALLKQRREEYDISAKNNYNDYPDYNYDDDNYYYDESSGYLYE